MFKTHLNKKNIFQKNYKIFCHITIFTQKYFFYANEPLFVPKPLNSLSKLTFQNSKKNDDIGPQSGHGPPPLVSKYFFYTKPSHFGWNPLKTCFFEK